jgi:membrane protein DedA with SNARE-associated domain
MGERIFDLLRMHFHQHGYLTVGAALLLENAGVPVPGETILLFASFLASTEHHLHIHWIILVATIACTLGDNIGYLIGHHGGRPLLDRWKHIFHVRQSHIDHGERLFARFGPATIFFARFIFGMRIVAGPLAGVLRMEWKAFALFNFLGAATWVTVISLIGYLFGRHWGTLLRIVRNFNIAIVVAVVVVVLLLWRRQRKRQTPAPAPQPEEEKTARK